ncbi:MAG: N-formylglutamate deformylase [Arenimonas sp.]
MKNDILQIHQGVGPLLISLPHDGSAIPEPLQERMLPSARTAPDTDWYVSRLYSFAKSLGATILQPKYSRYVIDLNRPPDDVSLYPGQNITGLCPTRQFTGEDVYLDGQEPGADEIDSRIEQYWRPYHDALKVQIERLHSLHGRVLLWEGHSIKSQVPFLFEGRLPDFNVGTVAGASCKPDTQKAIEQTLASQSNFSWVTNGRFKGGHITRHYHDLGTNIETVQLELAQCTYMDENSLRYDEALAGNTQQQILTMLEAALS